MPSTIKRLTDARLISPPKWLPDNIQLEVIMGSFAYGVSSDTSDCDIYGFAIPRKEMIFPHLRGEIPGFGRQIKRFEQYQQHHILDRDAMAGKGRNYDLTIYNIIKYFQLCMDNNPNIIDSLYVPINCILHSTTIGNILRDNRQLFLHKGSYHKFRGYAYSQLHKIRTREQILEGEAKIKIWEENKKGPRPSYRSVEGKRRENIIKTGFDSKFAYHVCRLLDEIEQILMFGDLNLQRSKEYLKAIRRGEVTLKEVKEFFNIKEKELEKLYHSSKLRNKPNENQIKELLLNCLEEHYGSLNDTITIPNKLKSTLQEISEIIDRALHGTK